VVEERRTTDAVLADRGDGNLGGRGRTVNASSRNHQDHRATTVQCVECNSSSGLYWQGWRAYRVDDPDTDELPALAFYCPTCAQREFGFKR
jgi:hypothetical protein